MLSNDVNAYTAYTECVCVTIFSTGSKFRPVSNFMELHGVITLAAHSYATRVSPGEPGNETSTYTNH